MVRYEIGPSLHLKMENDQIQNEGKLRPLSREFGTALVIQHGGVTEDFPSTFAEKPKHGRNPRNTQEKPKAKSTHRFTFFFSWLSFPIFLQ